MKISVLCIQEVTSGKSLLLAYNRTILKNMKGLSLKIFIA